MSQNARVALFIPTTADADPGEIIEIRGTAAVGRPLPTRFFPQAGSAGGIGEAPVDGKLWARQNADWSVTVGEAPSDGLMWGRKSNSWQQIPAFPEAPTDSKQYARQNAAWSVVTPFPEAPTDGKQYARSMSAWTEVTSLPAVIDGGTF